MACEQALRGTGAGIAPVPLRAGYGNRGNFEFNEMETEGLPDRSQLLRRRLHR